MIRLIPGFSLSVLKFGSQSNYLRLLSRGILQTLSPPFCNTTAPFVCRYSQRRCRWGLSRLDAFLTPTFSKFFLVDLSTRSHQHNPPFNVVSPSPDHNTPWSSRRNISLMFHPSPHLAHLFGHARCPTQLQPSTPSAAPRPRFIVHNRLGLHHSRLRR